MTTSALLQDIRIFNVQDRRSNPEAKRPWIVRWAVDRRQHSRAFRTKAEAERFRAMLFKAQYEGVPFDPQTGRPVSGVPGDDLAIHTWARRWLASQWSEWQPRTRRSAVEALARFIPLVVSSSAPSAPPTLRAHLMATLPPVKGPAQDKGNEEAERWLDRWCLALRQLDRQVLAEADARLGVGDRGQQLSPSTASRFRKVSRACIRRAVDLEILAVDPWPPPPRGRAKRKATRTKRAVDVRKLPDPDTMATVLAAIPNHQPSSRMYQVMTATAYYAGLRPSEVVMLRASCLELPDTGWGAIEVREADISFDEPGEPKTGPRTVPIPPVLVSMFKTWLAERQLEGDDLLFRTRTGHRPTASNWSRSWKLALNKAGERPLRIYDCRHAAATTWLRAGVPLGEVARRLGHSVDTLVSTYVGALATDEDVANERIEAVLAGTAG